MVAKERNEQIELNNINFFKGGEVMKKKMFIVSFVAVLAVSLLLVVSNNSAAQSKMHIKFSTWHPPVAREVKTVFVPMLEELKKRSNGRITYTMYAGGALGKGTEHYDIAAKGLSDMGYFTATWTPGRFPLSDVLSLAVWVDGKDIGVDIGNAMYKRILHREFPGVKMIELNGCIQAFLYLFPVGCMRQDWYTSFIKAR